MVCDLKRSLAVLGSVLVVSLAAPGNARAENPFKSFFDAIGNSVKGASRAATDSFNGNDNRRRKSSGQNFTSESARPKVVADPKLRNTQTALNKLGFNAGTPDGIYGKKTGTAINQFQASIGRPQTGRLSADERDILFERARNAKQFASTTVGGQQVQGLQAQDPDVKDSLPSSSESSYFDADEPEDEAIPTALPQASTTGN